MTKSKYNNIIRTDILIGDDMMTAYDMMIRANYHIIKGEKFSESQKTKIINELLQAKSNKNQINNFKKGVKAPEYYLSIGQLTDNRIMYPLFYVPPYNNGKKY